MELERLMTVTAALALMTLPVAAADHPDITGTWTLDAATSDFGPMPAPGDLVFKITVQGPDFTLDQSGGGQADMSLRFNTSGKEVANDLPGGRMTSSHHWEGQVLVGEIKLVTGDGATITFRDQISYSLDGKVMTVKRSASGPMGDGQMTMVLNRK
jgi:hypothetical protein